MSKGKVNLGQALSAVIRKGLCAGFSNGYDGYFVDSKSGTYRVVDWSGSENVIQITAEYSDGQRRAIGAKNARDYVASPEEVREYWRKMSVVQTKERETGYILDVSAEELVRQIARKKS